MTSKRRFFRPALLSAACILTLATATLPAQESRLPDMGSSAGRILSPAKQSEYGAMMLAQLRHYGYTLDDPLLDQWLQAVGQRLAAASDRPEQSFTFFLLKDRQINAFATLGGYIGTNAGLILAAEREDEMAAVLGHEIAHVTQTHVLRAVERAQRDQIPILLGMLAAIMVAQQSSSSNSGDAAMAAVMGAQGLMIQRQIDYTRSNESEADRLGIRTLARSGYDPAAMAAFFERMQASSRANLGSEESRLPDYLRTHPVTTTRIAEAKTRAERLPPPSRLAAADAHNSSNPLLPGSLKLNIEQPQGDSGDFVWARERLRVLSATSPREAIGEYERMARAKPLDEAARYGLALAKIQASQAASARDELTPLAARHPSNRWLQLALAEAEARSGQTAASEQRFARLRARYPNDPAVAISAARVLVERGDAEAARKALAMLRPLLGHSTQTPAFQRIFARANEIAGDLVRAGEAHAEAEYLNGNPERALLQLNTLLRRPDLDYYARARIDARIIAITPVVEELRRLGMNDKTLER
ncbi:peptidase [Lysobacteraceae bacterium NML120232]|nr:peptidase [Xanthomonadaceae bacterium NML120232]